MTKQTYLWAAGMVLCLISIPLACAFGPLDFSFSLVLKALLAPTGMVDLPPEAVAITPGGGTEMLDSARVRLVVTGMRLPRVLLALFTGAGLAIAGAVFQSILRNPLADPFTLGVSSGAACGAAVAISFGLTGAAFGFGLPLAAFAGAGCALFAVLLLGRIGGGLRHETLILAGVIVSAFLAALIALIKALDESSVTGIVFWIMGSFQGRGSRELLLFLPGCAVGCLIAWFLARELDMLSLGDRAARHLGLGTGKIRLILLIAAGAVTASCVAVSGIIGFIGLIIPHLCRMLLGAEHRRLLPACALAGGLLLLWSDTAARTMLPGGVELPVGVLTALLGGPFFCFILHKRNGSATAPVFMRVPDSVPDMAEDLQSKESRIKKLQADESATKTSGGTHEPAGLPGHDPDKRHTAAESNSSMPARATDRKAPPLLVCEKLSYRYTHRSSAPRTGAQAPNILDDISFVLQKGTFTGLLGPNGSGKSTLLQCMSGLLKPRQGCITINGHTVDTLGEKEQARLVATLAQAPEAIPALSVFSLVLMGRYAHTPFLGAYSSQDYQTAKRALSLVNAGHLAGRPASCLSGGELQRVLLARAIAQEAPLLLLDEVTAGLDPKHQSAALDAVKLLQQRNKLTIFAALHDINLAATYCDRLIFLKNGMVVADGKPEEVFTADTLSTVYDARFTILRHPRSGLPQALPEEAAAL